MDINIMDFIKPELLIVAVVCYFCGMWFKATTFLQDKFIPIAIGAISCVLCCIYLLATTTVGTWQDAVMGIFVGLTQGVLMAGLSTYINQIFKQLTKGE